MGIKKSICFICAAAMLLSSCARLKDARERAASAVGSVKEEISSVIEKAAETGSENGDTEQFDPFKIYYDESEPEIHYYGKAPEHFALTAKYFDDEPEEEPVDYYMDQNYSCFDIYEDHAVFKMIFIRGGEPEDLVIPSEAKGVPVTEISEKAFYKNERIKSVTIPESVTKIGKDAFRKCSSLEKAEIHGDVGEGAFAECEALRSVTLYGNAGQEAFSGCVSLERFDMRSGTSIGAEAFYKTFKACEKLSDVKVPDGLEYLGEDAFRETPFKASLSDTEKYVMLGKVLVRYNDKESAAPKVPEGTVMLGSFVFSGMENAEELKIPEGVKYIGAHACDCSKFRRVYLPSTLERIEERAFIGCDEITEIEFPENLEYIGRQSFESCVKLADIKFNEKLSFIHGRAFDDTAWLYNNYGLTIVNGILVRCNGDHREYTVPDGVIAIADKAFYSAFAGEFIWNCRADKIVLPDSIEYIGESAFKEVGLEEVNMPANLKVIGDEAFYANFFTELELPEGLTELGEGAFESCTHLRKAVIPHSITALPENLFWNCCVMSDIYIPDSVEEIGAGAFYNEGSITYHCSKDSYADSFFGPYKKRRNYS